MKKNLLLLFLMGLTSGLFAQNFETFKGIKSEGEVPKDFFSSSLDNYNEALKKNDSKKVKRDFYQNTRFAVDEILHSGKVVFNDPISNYVKNVAKVLLKDDLDLFKQLKFYTIKSNISNAFSTDQGIIFFTTGLISRLKNEAQLASILSHEIAHYTEKHVKEYYLNQKKQAKISKVRSFEHNLNTIRSLNEYSRKNELIADSLGVQLFLQSSYNPSEILTTFSILKNDNLPFENKPFDKAYFNVSEVNIPIHFFLKQNNYTVQTRTVINSTSTHPNIELRISLAEKIIKKHSTKKGEEKYIVSEQRFKTIRDLSRFESVKIHVQKAKYIEAIYEIFILEEEFTENSFLNLSKLQCYYGLTKYLNKNNFLFKKRKPLPENVEGESRALHYFFFNLTSDQLNIIALRNAYDIAKLHPQNELIQLYSSEIKKEFALNTTINNDTLLTKSYNDFLARRFEYLDQEKKISDSAQYKTSFLATKRKIAGNTFSNRKSLNSGLNKEFDIEKPYKTPEYMNGSHEKTNLLNEMPYKVFHLYYLYDLILNDNLKEELDSIRLEITKEDTIKNPIKNLLIFDPYFANQKLRGKKNLLKTEEGKNKISDYYQDDYKDINMNISIFKQGTADTLTVDFYNKYASLTSWFEEIMLHDGIGMMPSNQHVVEPLINEFETSYFLFSGIVAYKGFRHFSNKHIWLIAGGFTIPLVILDLLIPRNNFRYVSFLIDAKTYTIKQKEEIDANLKGNMNVLHLYVYDLLKKIDQNEF